MQINESVGQRLNHLLRNRALAVWSHVILGLVGGCVLALSMISARMNHVLNPLAVFSRGFGSVAAYWFAIGSLPILGSYLANKDRVDEDSGLTIRFLIALVFCGLVVDGAVVYLVQGGVGFWTLLLIYITQFAILKGLGEFMLPSSL